MRVAVKQDNRRINRLRSVVQWNIAQNKTWRVLHTDCPAPVDLGGDGVFFPKPTELLPDRVQTR